MRGHLGEKIRKHYIWHLPGLGQSCGRLGRTCKREVNLLEKAMKYLLVDPILPTRGVGEPELLPDANDLPGDRLKEDEVVHVVLSDLRVHEVVPGIQVWIRKTHHKMVESTFDE